jgi:hypothetical protein
MTIRYQGAPSRSGRSSTITRCYSGAWSGAQAPSATRWPAASPASDRSRSCAITWTMRSCPCRGGGTLPLPGGGHADPWQRAGPCAHPRAPQAGVPGRTASAWRRRRRGGHHRGVDRCPVRRARDEGERPAASRPHRRGRGPWSPTRRHAHAAGRRARVMPLHLEEEHIIYPSSALSAWQLAIMAVVVVAVPAAWLTLVLLAARDRRRGSAATDAGGRDEETGATVTQLPSSDTPSGKAA